MDLQQAKAAIRDLIETAVHVIDDERYEDWPELFAEQCSYRIVTREGLERGHLIGVMACGSRGMLRDRVNSLRKANIYEPHRYRHLLGPTRVLDPRDEGPLRARTGFALVRIMQDGRSELFLSGVYEDSIELSSEGSRFLERRVVLDSPRIDTLIVLPV
ncbi:MAG: aromatic-ring-hydroxylating dioxygenase subunit beta [Pigmentiphaga sp.]|uniref:aromatic-ring-hydroxylating dioxygenase subunit beta n=1 Tax=Pigmentiphaga sp. TaxID=1977564 RepID=UPI0029A156B0|nr:aromatic-ring-hydroxylating dioxygenase subunit beta [Pigmentiphaga sp.]MDX3906932.1 aromatic-ring-hydroxylating dioxygenase subunit beta [Pigmentiphaga sp.]